MHIQNKIIKTWNSFLNENSNKEIKDLQKELRKTDEWFFNNTCGTPGYKDWDKQAEYAAELRRKLFTLTGDYYGKTKADKDKENTPQKGLNDRYDDPTNVPKAVYKWLVRHSSLLTDDATDAIRWFRIINTKDDSRYPRGEITIYRAVDNKNYDDIRAGDWVTTQEIYAIQHNDMYFDGNGKVISMAVDGRDVLVSPTGNYEEAICVVFNKLY